MDECIQLVNIALQDEDSVEDHQQLFSPPQAVEPHSSKAQDGEPSHHTNFQDGEPSDGKTLPPTTQYSMKNTSTGSLMEPLTLKKNLDDKQQFSKNSSTLMPPVDQDSDLSHYLSASKATQLGPATQEEKLVERNGDLLQNSIEPLTDPVTPEMLVDCLCDREVLTRVIQLIKERRRSR